MYRHEKQYPHNQSIKRFIGSFRHTKLSGALTALYTNRIMQQVAGSLIGVFFPILLYTAFDLSFYKVVIYYLISWTVWFFVIPLSAKVMCRIGMKKSMIMSVVVGWGWYYFARLFEIELDLTYLVLALISITLYRFFYWIPYHTDFAEFSDKKTRGRQLALLANVAAVVSIFLPIVSGYVIENFGYSYLFWGALVIFLLSFIPLLYVPEIKEKFDFGYWQTFSELFSKKNRTMLLSYGADGIQGMAGSVVWPIFIWLLLDKSYSAVGVISSLIVLVSLILRSVLGNLTDKKNKKKLIKWGSILCSIAWFVKMFVASGFQIFIASTYHNFANVVMRTPFEVLMYERAADSGHYVDEYTALREMALNVGRIIMLCLILLIFFLTGSFVIPFVLAAVAALLMSRL